jgi:hypothetical protein
MPVVLSAMVSDLQEIFVPITVITRTIIPLVPGIDPKTSGLLRHIF